MFQRVCGLSGKDIYKGNGESWYIGIIRNKKRYLVYVPDDVRRILEKYEKISNSGRVDSSEPYFKNPYGKKCNTRMSERSLEMKIKALADANGLSGVFAARYAKLCRGINVCIWGYRK